MPAFMVETQDSRDQVVSADQPTFTAKYLVNGIQDDDDVRVIVEANIPAFAYGLILQSYRLSPVVEGIWHVEASYGRREPRKPGTVTFNFDTTGGHEKVTHSLGSQYYPASGQDVIDFGGAINVKDSGGKQRIEGVEIPVPHFAFTVSKTFGETDTPLTQEALLAIVEKTGHVNSDDVDTTIQGVNLNLPAGSLKYLGVTGSKGSDGQADLTLKFEVSKNLENQTIAGIPGVNKKGWHYLWVKYEEEEDATAKTLKPVARQVCVDQVIPETTLSELFT